MKQSLWNRQIPGLFIVFLLILSFVTVSFVTHTTNNPFTHASAGPEPLDMQITNVTSQSFTVSYRTNAATVGTVSYGTNGKTTNTVFDDRDKSSSAGDYNIHYFTLTNLTPNTKYSFIILSGGNTYTNNNAPYTVSTIQPISQPAKPQVIQGNITFPSGADPEAIVYATASGSQPISSLVSKAGKYLIDTGSMLTADGTAYIQPATTSLHLLVQDGDGIQATTDLANALSQIVPPIVLGSSYDFSQISPTSEASMSAALFPTVFLSKTVQKKVQILTPSQGQAFSDQQPTFTGTAAPKTKVTITIHSATPITTSVQTDALGNWTFTPPADLAPGQHTITITADDASGIAHTLTSTFYVYSSGGNFLVPSVETSETPTPSIADVSLTPTTTIIPSVTTTVTDTPTPTTVTVTDTPTPTLTDTPTEIPTEIIAQISPTNETNITGTPVTGSDSAAMSALIALIPVILGGLLIYLSKGIVR